MFIPAKSHLQVTWLALHPTTHRSLPSFACLITFLWVSLPLRVQGWTGGGVLRVVKEVWMCVRADLYLPHVWEQETSCLLSCLSPVLFMLLLIPGSLLIAKREEHFFNTLSEVFASPERARTANANIPGEKNPKDFLGLFHPAISKRKQAG